MVYKFLEQREVETIERWECGDGCCSGNSYSSEFFNESSLITLYETHNCERDEFLIDGRETFDGEPIFIKKYLVNELLEDAIITLVS